MHPTARRPVVALVVDAIFPYHIGGREIRYYELTARLARAADVHVYTMRWWRGPRKVVDGNVTFDAITKAHPMYIDGRRAIKQALFFTLGCFRLLGCRFDVLDADHMPYLHIPVLRAIATLKRKRLVVTWHEVWGKAYWRDYLGLAGYLAWFVEWFAMRLPDHIVAASPQTAERLTAITGGKASVTVAPNGVDFDVVRNTEPDAARTDFVVVGRLIGHKRVDMLFDAMALLNATGLPTTCRVVGDGPSREALQRHAAALGLSDAVDFRHDLVEQKDVYALVKAAKVAVFPSEREGFGAAVLEALACQVPVVTTSSPDNLSQHLVSRSARGRVCHPSAWSLADALRVALEDDTARPDGLGSDSWLEQYSWEATARHVAEVLRIQTTTNN